MFDGNRRDTTMQLIDVIFDYRRVYRRPGTSDLISGVYFTAILGENDASCALTARLRR